MQINITICLYLLLNTLSFDTSDKTNQLEVFIVQRENVAHELEILFQTCLTKQKERDVSEFAIRPCFQVKPKTLHKL